MNRATTSIATTSIATTSIATTSIATTWMMTLAVLAGGLMMQQAMAQQVTSQQVTSQRVAQPVPAQVRTVQPSRSYRSFSVNPARGDVRRDGPHRNEATWRHAGAKPAGHYAGGR